MALGAVGFAIEQLQPTLSVCGQWFVFSEIGVERAIHALPFRIHERRERIGNMYNGDVAGAVDIVKTCHKLCFVVGNFLHAPRDKGPGGINTRRGCAGDWIFLRIACHLELRGQWEKRLRCGDIVETFGQEPFRRRGKPVVVTVIPKDPAIMKQIANAFVSDVPKRWRMARNASSNTRFSSAGGALWAKAKPALTYAQAKPICAAIVVMMACAAGDILVTTQYFIIEKQLSDACFFGIAAMKLIRR